MQINTIDLHLQTCLHVIYDPSSLTLDVGRSACQHVVVLTVAFTNQKGGVGKTSTVVGVAAALADTGARVLCIDLDPQADLTEWLGCDPLAPVLNINDVIYADTRTAAAGAIQPCPWNESIAVVGSSLDLAARETDLSPGAEFRLAKALEGVENFDVVLIDCPPSIGRLVAMAFVAATHLIVVTEPSAASLRGVANVLKTADVVREHYNPDLMLAGIVLNHAGRTSESALRTGELTAVYGHLVWEPHVPVRAVVAAAMGAAAPASAYGADGRAVTDVYAALAVRVRALGTGHLDSGELAGPVADKPVPPADPWVPSKATSHTSRRP